ncbi:hypothetical protein [Micromonospora parva]|uniref:Uncharacterized protein n=1 Tax=Micromonospora parva TaxID=1464048 RepID=A0ABW6VMY2_9ACTN
MRLDVADAVCANGAALRQKSAPMLIAALTASALSPVIAAAVGAGGMWAAGAGVVGSVGANIASNVVDSAVNRLRAANAEPTAAAVEADLAERVGRAFAAGDPARQDLRGCHRAVPEHRHRRGRFPERLGQRRPGAQTGDAPQRQRPRRSRLPIVILERSIFGEYLAQPPVRGLSSPKCAGRELRTSANRLPLPGRVVVEGVAEFARSAAAAHYRPVRGAAGEL